VNVTVSSDMQETQRKYIYGSVLVLLLVSILTVLAVMVSKGATQAFDSSFIMELRNGQNPSLPLGPAWLKEMGRDVTSLGSYVFLLFVVFSSLGYLMILRKRGEAALLLMAFVGGSLLSAFLKVLVSRPRPNIATDVQVFTASFPSGHATLATVTFLILGVIFAGAHENKALKVYLVAIMALLTLMVGLSRLYLGVHYPTDVIAGWCLGGAWATACGLFASRLRERSAYIK